MPQVVANDDCTTNDGTIMILSALELYVYIGERPVLTISLLSKINELLLFI